MVNVGVLSAIVFSVVACFHEIHYEVIVNKIEQLVTNKTILDFSRIKLRKFNRTTQIWSGPFEAFIDMDNSVEISISGFKRAGNEWRPTPFRVPLTPYCDYAKNEKFYFEIFYQHAALNSKAHCPAIPKGKYVLRDLPLGAIKIPPFLEGEYWMKQKITYRGEVVDELSVFCMLLQFQ